MKVGVDARCLNTAHVRGMGKYVLEMLSHAGAVSRHIRWHLFGDRPEMAVHRPACGVAEVDLFDVKGYRFRSWEQFGLPLRARRARLDVLHCVASTLPYWQPVPVIVTLHDTLPWEDTKRGGYEAWYWHRLLPAALHRSQAIVTISDASRRDIMARWPKLAAKLHVIPHGIADAYLQARTARPPSVLSLAGARPYLLYVGGIIERKRFSWATRILAELNDTNVCMVACGFTAEEALAVGRGLQPIIRERVYFLPFVPEADMPALYQHAAAVLYPTLYEGFGLPALEAQAVGTPVLFSALGSLKELIGPGAIVLPEHDLGAWVRAVRDVLTDGEYRARNTHAARIWAQQFSWEASARRHVALYEQAASAAA